MTVWELYLVTLSYTNVSIYNTNKNDYVYHGKNADIPLSCMNCEILNVTVCNNSELLITIW